ncbi:diguanylate cyclase [bacterium]|nr:diguanylate cyclase [bacterium]
MRRNLLSQNKSRKSRRNRSGAIAPHDMILLESNYRELVRSTHELIQILRPDGSFEYVNRAWRQAMGYSRKDVKSLNIFDIIRKDYKKDYILKFKKVMSGVRLKEFITVLISKKGRDIFVRGTVVPRIKNGKVVEAFSFCENVTALEKSTIELKNIRIEFKTIYDSTGYAFMIVTPDEGFLSCNKATLKMFGCRKESEFTSHSPSFFSPRRQKDGELSSVKARKMMNIALKKGAYSFEWVHKKLPGKEFYANVLLNRMVIKNKKVLLAVVTDITKANQAEEKLAKANMELVETNKKLMRLALRDSHTGLFNHRYMAQTVEAEFFRAKRNVKPLAVLMLDIDFFKSVNDIYGHRFGDMVLKEFAEVISGEVRQYDIVARYGGEEFVIILPGATRKTAFSLSQRILDKLSLYSFGTAGQTIKIKVSIGVAAYPEDAAQKGMALIDIADGIMMKAKEDGGNRVYSSLEADDRPSIIQDASQKTVSIKNLSMTIKRLSKRANQSLVEAIFAFAKTIKFKDPYTGDHVEETVHYALMLARALGISSKERELIKQASILHDLGKIGISGKLLRKKGNLTDAEFKEIKKHSQIGADILSGVFGLSAIVPLILYHHEWWNGMGYPAGLKGNEIPMGSRIIAVADVYQSLISKRSYSRIYSEKEALEVIKKAAGKQFDPAIVKVFEKVIKKYLKQR